MRITISPNLVLYFLLLVLGASGFLFVVVWPSPQGLYAFIVSVAIGGFGVAAYIYDTKKHKRQLVCPTGSNCNAVVTSRYAAFLGISNEYLGIFYYGAITFFYLGLLTIPERIPASLLFIVMLLTASAFLFSLYLIFVQAVLLRQWCIWCLLSSAFSITIFIVSLASLEVAVALLLQIAPVLAAIHALGFALGIGGATTAAFLFFRFLRDLVISDQEDSALKGVSELVWFGLGLSLMGQFAFFVMSADVLAQSATFLVQTIALLGAAFAGAVLMIIFAPFFPLIHFKHESSREADGHPPSVLESLRRPVFISGALALVSWYFAFLMDYVPDVGLVPLLAAYAGALAVAVGAGIVLEKAVGSGKFV